MLRRRVLGLVIVVPRLAWRACPRLNGVVGLAGDCSGVGLPADGADAVLMRARVGEPAAGAALSASAFSSDSATPLGETGAGWENSEGVVGWEERMAFPSSESASKRSGGRRSFSISDLRLIVAF
jgi:hypothetical protein